MAIRLQLRHVALCISINNNSSIFTSPRPAKPESHGPAKAASVVVVVVARPLFWTWPTSPVLSSLLHHERHFSTILRMPVMAIDARSLPEGLYRLFVVFRRERPHRSTVGRRMANENELGGGTEKDNRINRQKILGMGRKQGARLLREGRSRLARPLAPRPAAGRPRSRLQLLSPIPWESQIVFLEKRKRPGQPRSLDRVETRFSQVASASARDGWSIFWGFPHPETTPRNAMVPVQNDFVLVQQL